MESTLYAFLPDGVFLPSFVTLSPPAGFLTSACVTMQINQSNNHSNEDKLCESFTRNGTDQCQNVSSNNFLTPYREQPRSTRVVVAYPRAMISALKH